MSSEEIVIVGATAHHTSNYQRATAGEGHSKSPKPDRQERRSEHISDLGLPVDNCRLGRPRLLDDPC